jgi:phenylpropionate dioxygenase-like ring-hydroxylating dioxygenase large terminal subunit
MTASDTPPPGLSADDIARAALPLDQAWTLPPAAYLSTPIYEREVERLMRGGWLPVARLDQVGEPGDYLCLDLFGQPVMVVRGTDGEVRVMSRVCLHRAAEIAEGTGNRKLFTCPYHAWSYDTAGALIRAPLMDGAQGFVESACRLPQIRTEIWEGFVVVNLDGAAPPLAPQVEGFSSYFRRFGMADMVVARTLEFDSGWNWKVLVENFMEAYHHIATHAHTFEPLFPARDSRVPDNDGPWSILHMPAVDPQAPASPLIEGLTQGEQRDLFAGVIFPHFMIALHGAGMVWYQVLPSAADRLLLKIHVCLPRSAKDLAEYEEIATAAEQFSALVHAEDIAANDTVWRGLNAPLSRQGRLSPLERSIWQMNQWWIARMGGN